MHIALVTGAGEQPFPNALATVLCGVWRQQGHAVSVGPTVPPGTDVALLHINTTTIDEAAIPTAPDAVPVLNRHALDISKRLVSKNLVDPDSAYDGAVIVKTDDNCFGGPRWPQSLPHLLTNQLRRVVGPSTWRHLRLLPRRDYPVLPSKRDVPDWVWRRKDLVVEKFTPEKDGDFYVLRQWLFLGAREYGTKLYSREPVIKTRNMARYEYVYDVPDFLRAERARLGMDFGKFDYVVVDGQPILLDANKTPTVGLKAKPSDNLMNLAAGLEDFAANA